MGISALDAYLVFDGGGSLPVPEGETYDKTLGTLGAMQVSSFALTSQVELGDEAAGTEPPTTRDSDRPTPFFKLKITKPVDYASPDLFCAYCKQKADKKLFFDKAKLVVRKAGAQKPLVYFVLQMERVVIESYKLNADDPDDLPDEDITLSFVSMRIFYYPQKSDGSLGTQQFAGWDFGKQKAL
jgi:type VI protein secretion system component Hcp